MEFLLALWAQSQWWADLHKLNMWLNCNDIWECPVSLSLCSSGCKGWSVKNFLVPYLWKGVGACPFPYRCAGVIRCCLSVFISPFSPSLIVQGKAVPAYVVVDSAKWPQAMSTLPINPAARESCWLCPWSASGLSNSFTEDLFSARTCKFSHCFYQTLSLKAIHIGFG